MCLHNNSNCKYTNKFFKLQIGKAFEGKNILAFNGCERAVGGGFDGPF
jgi:hypothetical protein